MHGVEIDHMYCSRTTDKAVTLSEQSYCSPDLMRSVVSTGQPAEQSSEERESVTTTDREVKMLSVSSLSVTEAAELTIFKITVHSK